MKTKRVLTNQAQPGMIVADDVYTYNNQLIIAKDTALTNRAITRLNFYSITDIMIQCEEDETSVNEEELTFLDEIRATTEYKEFHKKYNETTVLLKGILNGFISKESPKINIEALSNQMQQLIAETRNGTHIFNMLQCMRDYSDLTFVHSVNVALICHTIGTWLHLDQNDLDALTVSGLLHDIGKLLVPQEIIEKPTDLTDEEYRIIKTHSLKGYELVKEQIFDMRIKLSILMHHERCDGSGYPRQLTGPQIIDFAKIVGLADTYDAMTSARLYRSPMCPFEVISIFESEGLQKYDPHILLTFLHGIADTYIHGDVKLSDGQEGKIVLINNNCISKPIVKVGDEFIDLSKRPNLSIVRVF